MSNKSTLTSNEILREVSTLDCFYTGAACPPDCQCLSARAGRAINSPAHEMLSVDPPQRYRVQQDKGEYALKGCSDGDLVDYSAYEALLRRFNQPHELKAGFCEFGPGEHH